MSNQRWLPSTALAGVIGLSLIICCVVLARSVVRIKTDTEVVRVTGSARQLIRSDLIIWKGRVVARGATLNEAYVALNADMAKVKDYLKEEGIQDEDILDTPIRTEKLYAPLPQSEAYYVPQDVYREVIEYELSQEVEIRSTDVEAVDRLARKATELMSKGVSFESQPPEYIYTKLGEMKITMLGEAAKDARERAEQIAENTGCRLGEVRYARMSPMRITPAYELVELDSFGTNDTSSLEKEITAVVSVAYSIR